MVCTDNFEGPRVSIEDLDKFDAEKGLGCFLFFLFFFFFVLL